MEKELIGDNSKLHMEKAPTLWPYARSCLLASLGPSNGREIRSSLQIRWLALFQFNRRVKLSNEQKLGPVFQLCTFIYYYANSFVVKSKWSDGQRLRSPIASLNFKRNNCTPRFLPILIFNRNRMRLARNDPQMLRRSRHPRDSGTLWAGYYYTQ